MSWTHAICDPCWQARSPGRVPFRMAEHARTTEICCRCGRPTTSGIYQRHDPDDMPCRGEHK